MSAEPGSGPRPATALGFDFGERMTGVAVGQTVTGTATPLGTVAARGAKPDWAEVKRFVEEWRPDVIVVGLPLNMDGSDQDMTHAARRFARELGRRFSLPVELVDERLTTREARDRLASVGRIEEDDDPVAAQIILEDWLRARQ